MASAFKTVDLFAGPGGLAEGFASLRDSTGARVFEIAISVEKEPSAFATLRLRAFTRKFQELPSAYYQYVAGNITLDELKASHPAEWEAAESETAMLELGTDAAKAALDPRLDKLRAESSRTIVIGGPPCQAYSLVGRARNRGIRGYIPAEDSRHFLYREYIRILEKLRPAAFVMENVKGMLSATVDGETIFHRILDDLKSAGGAPAHMNFCHSFQMSEVWHRTSSAANFSASPRRAIA
jgi:DNA (cytosine-5)-methyltransferase 1